VDGEAVSAAKQLNLLLAMPVGIRHYTRTRRTAHCSTPARRVEVAILSGITPEVCSTASDAKCARTPGAWSADRDDQQRHI